MKRVVTPRAMLAGWVGILLSGTAFGAIADPPPDRPTALHIASGSVVSREVVALGRDLVVLGEARADVAVIRGSARIDGRVDGSVIVLSGNAWLGPQAVVGRDVYVLGGRLETSAGAVVGGKAAAYPTAAGVWLALLEGPALGAAVERTLLVAKLALLVAWAVALLLGLALRRREVLATSAAIADEPFRSFFVGLAVVVTAALLVVLVTAALSGLLGAPLVALVVLGAMGLKIFGLVAVFHALGDWLLTRLTTRRNGGRRGRRWLAVHAGTLGLVVLGLSKLVPVAGTLIWTVATLIGVGAAAVTKLGRHEPWLADSL